MSQERNCAFQYAKVTTGMFSRTTIIEDQSSLTLDEVKALWNKHYPDAAKWIRNGDTAEMVIWINMSSPGSYGESLQYIDSDAESDGVNIWKTIRTDFPKTI